MGRRIAVGLLAAAASTSALLLGGAGTAQASDLGQTCPTDWTATRTYVPVVSNGKFDPDVMLAYGDASSPEGTGECIAVLEGWGTSELMVGIANPPSGTVVFWHAGDPSTGTQTVPLP